MFTFPRLKSSENYKLYKHQALLRWQQLIYPTALLILLLELSRLIEDLYHKPYTYWPLLWKFKITEGKSEVSNEHQIRSCKLLDN